MPRGGYPETVVEVLDERKTFKPAVLRAVRAFAKSKPWRGTLEERQQKLQQLNHDLAAAYGMEDAPELLFGAIDGSSSGGSYYNPANHQIVISGKLSVVTFLHEFCHARGMGEREACRWSLNLFRRVFPRSFARSVHQGHMLVRPADITPRNDAI